MKKKYLERTMDFHNIYTEKVLPIVKRREFERQEIKKRRDRKKLFGIIALISSVTPFLLLVMLAEPSNTQNLTNIAIVLAIILFLLGIIILLNKDKESKNFILSLKHDCLSHVLKVFGDVVWQNGIDNVIPDEELNRTALFASFNKRVTDDIFKGSYNGVDFKICETDLTLESGSGKNRRVTQVFKGVVITFKSNKVIKNRTIIATKGDMTKKNGIWFIYLPVFLRLGTDIYENILKQEYNTVFLLIGILIFLVLMALLIKDDKEKLEEVKLEDPVLSKKYNVYSSEQVEARYLLTTAFVNRFQNLTTAFGTEKAKCSFYDGDKIMFAISTDKNLFEIGNVDTSLLDSTSINEFYNELSSIYKMIEYFKLDEKTGL